MNNFTRALAIGLSVTLFSCGGATDADKIGDAQFCFDKLDAGATVSQVNECVAMVDGITSPGAENIRCSGGFIREGFSSVQKYLDAFQAIEGGTGGSNMRAMMSLLSFTSGGAIATDYSNVHSTFNSCLTSGGKGSTLLASFAFFTMGLVKFFVAKGGCAGTPAGSPPSYDISGCLTGMAAHPADMVALGSAATVDADAIDAQSAIGSVIVSTYQLSCTGTGANVDLCGLLSSAITTAGGATNTRAVAVAFFNSVLN